MAGSGSQTKAKGRKIGRTKKRRERAGSPISLFVKGKISAQKYWELSGISTARAKEVS
jgi:hypothetical protein